MTTRRDMIKAGVGLAEILAAGKAPAAFVRSMLGLRNAMLDENRVPYDSKVEWLLNDDGKSYINPPINEPAYIVKPNDTVGIGLINTGDTNAWRAAFGVYKSDYSVIGIGRQSSYATRFRCAFGRFSATNISLAVGVKYNLELTKTSLVSNGSIVATFADSSANMPDGESVCLFKMRESNPSAFIGKISHFYIRDKAGAYKCYLEAVRIGTIGYFYDSVAKVLFPNATSGILKPGTDVT